VAVVIGASDSGKTTWIGVAARHLIGADRLPLAIVDADVGQSTVGPPSTIALTLLHEPTIEFAMDCLPCHALCFIGPSRLRGTCFRFWSGRID
jgi:polynucleotide 5'-hydroxyl-kinase GRC3/NOL9